MAKILSVGEAPTKSVVAHEAWRAELTFVFDGKGNRLSEARRRPATNYEALRRMSDPLLAALARHNVTHPD
jgi:hypothetical protein